MSKPKKICVVTTTRADYGLLFWLMKYVESSPTLDLQVVVTGMHLSAEYGNTYQHIQRDGFKITAQLSLDLSNDSNAAVAQQMSDCITGFSSIFNEIKPDLVVLLGDRYEVFAISTAAYLCQKPIAHIHGGETTEGALDEAFRHSITKMSYLHFASAEKHRNRIIQLGESPDRVFNVGAMGLDQIAKTQFLERTQLEIDLGFSFQKQNILITYHPTTLHSNTHQENVSEILKALDQFPGIGAIFTKPNSDTGNQRISRLLEEYVSKNSHRCVIHTNLGQLRYLSALQYVDAVVGNSSSGIMEVPAFEIGTINIGDRQKGRLCGKSVVHCELNEEEIVACLNRVMSSEFRQNKENFVNPYGEPGAAKKIINILEHCSLPREIKKTFYDVCF